MKTFLTLLLTAFLLTAPTPATAQTNEQATSAVSKSAHTGWLKRETARYTKAIKQLKKVKNDVTAIKAAKSIQAIFEDKAGNKKDPYPADGQNYSPLENQDFMKLATAVGEQLNRIQDLIDDGIISEEPASALVDTVLANMKVAE